MNLGFGRWTSSNFVARCKEEFQDSILEDLRLMGVHGDRISYTSDYFDQLYQYAIDMIKRDLAYADDTEKAKVRTWHA